MNHDTFLDGDLRYARNLEFLFNLNENVYTVCVCPNLVVF